jgi:parallel beta-helix repeat protein
MGCSSVNNQNLFIQPYSFLLWMFRKIVAVWVSLAMLFGFVVIVDVVTDITPPVKAASTLYVGGIGPGNYSSIQWAIDNATEGDTVFVYNGTYYENVVVNKTIYLTGDDRDTTVIDGGGSGNVVDITVDWVNVTGFTITNGSYGFNIQNGVNYRISNNDIYLNTQYGIYLRYSNNSIISGNIISDNENGIYLEWSSNINISGNQVLLNNDYGIHLYKSSKNTITNNTVHSNILRGIYLNSCPDNNITNNNISNNDGGILLGLSPRTQIENNSIISNGQYGIWVGSSSDNTITNNSIENNDHGIRLMTSSRDNYISGNNISNNSRGIGVYFSSERNTITGNDILFNGDIGIWLEKSPDNNISNNVFWNDGIVIWGDVLSHFNTHTIPDNNYVNGKPLYYFKNVNDINIDDIPIGELILANCTSFNISNMKINDTDIGIEIAYSSNVNINTSEFSENDPFGVFLYSSSNSNIMRNNISNNYIGLYLYESSEIEIYHNNILNNTYQAYDILNGNKWDNGYPSGGNYWSDYSGYDNSSGPNQDIPGSDGIGDTNYSIDLDSIDKYPLMGLYPSLPAENYSILKQGWNLISIPLIQNNQDLSKVLEMINGYYDAVQWYNPTDLSDSWKHHKISKPFGNDLSHLNESMGFWIHITQPGDTIFLYNGTQPTSNQSIIIHPGWNMVGYPSLINRTRDNALNNINYSTDVDAIWTFDAATQTWQEIGPSDYFELGRGYWIHSKVTKIWDVPL